MVVRKLVYGMGYRYRLHRKDLPGKPDLVFGARKKVIFVHGCFWHQHTDANCRIVRMPKSRLAYWETKLSNNVARDKMNQNAMAKAGWEVLIVWECETRVNDYLNLSNKLRTFLDQ